MEKLYRLVGAAGICFRAFGVTVGVRVNEPRILETLSSRFPPGFRHQDTRNVSRLYSFHVNRGERRRGVRRFHTLYSDQQILLRSEDEIDLYEEFEQDAVIVYRHAPFGVVIRDVSLVRGPAAANDEIF